MLITVLSMVAFALVGSISPGPVNIIASTTSLNHGLKPALFHVFGASLAFAVIILLLGLGLANALGQYPIWLEGLKLIGAAYLLYMAYGLAISPPGSELDQIKAPGLVDGFLCQVLNPKAWLFSLSGVSLFVLVNTPQLLYLSIFTLLAFVVCFIGVGCWALAGRYLARRINTAQLQQRFNRLMSALLCATVVTIICLPS